MSIMQGGETIDVAARSVIRLRGDAAFDHASRMARRYAKSGNPMAAREWLDIKRRIGELDAGAAEKSPLLSGTKRRA